MSPDKKERPRSRGERSPKEDRSGTRQEGTQQAQGREEKTPAVMKGHIGVSGGFANPAGVMSAMRLAHAGQNFTTISMLRL
ncbi:hypothetical protein D3C87_1756670 [compost metagenome]